MISESNRASQTPVTLNLNTRSMFAVYGSYVSCLQNSIRLSESWRGKSYRQNLLEATIHAIVHGRTGGYDPVLQSCCEEEARICPEKCNAHGETDTGGRPWGRVGPGMIAIILKKPAWLLLGGKNTEICVGTTCIRF